MPLSSLLERFRRGTNGTTPGARAPSPSDVELLRTRARRRLIGMVVLVGAGVLGFPWLFETQPRPVPVDIPIEIPRKDGAPPREVQGLTPSERWIAVRDGIVRKPSDIARRAATEVARFPAWQPSHYKDAIHPTAEGNHALAEVLRQVLTAPPAGPSTDPSTDPSGHTGG